MVILIGSYPFLSLRFFFYSPWQSSPAAGSLAAAQAWAEPAGRPVRRHGRVQLPGCRAATAAQQLCQSQPSKLSPVCPLPNSLILLLFYSPGVPKSCLAIKVIEGKRQSPLTAGCWKDTDMGQGGGTLGLDGEGEHFPVGKL